MSSAKERAKKVGTVDMPDPESQEVIDALSKMRAITPSQVATQFNIKISIANKFLKMLQEKGKIKLVTKSRNLKVYSINS